MTNLARQNQAIRVAQAKAARKERLKNAGLVLLVVAIFLFVSHMEYNERGTCLQYACSTSQQ